MTRSNAQRIGKFQQTSIQYQSKQPVFEEHAYAQGLALQPPVDQNYY